MTEELVAAALFATGAYLLAGAIVSVPVHLRGLSRIDPATAGAGLLFRGLITPGLVALWPLLLLRWRQATRGQDTAGALESPLTPEGLRRAHGTLVVFTACLSLAAATAAVALRPVPPPRMPDTDKVTPESPPLAYAKNLEQLFQSVPAVVFLARSIDTGHSLLFDFGPNGPIPPTALYWAPSPLAMGQLPPDVVFVSMLWGPGRQWVPLPEPEMALGGYLFTYSFKNHEVESVPAPRAVR